MDKSEPNFSLNDFKKWMSGQSNFVKKSKFKGCFAESKIGLKRLVAKIESDTGDLFYLARDFKRNGGTILECDVNNLLLIEVSSGTFKIPKFFVKIMSNLHDES
jgi:hypothetical protein